MHKDTQQKREENAETVLPKAPRIKHSSLLRSVFLSVAHCPTASDIMFQDLRRFYALYAVSTTPTARHISVLQEEDSGSAPPSHTTNNTICIDHKTGKWSYCEPKTGPKAAAVHH